MKFVLSFLPLCLLLNACPASSFVPGITSPFKYNIRSPTRSSAKGGLYDIYAPLRSTTEGTDIGSKRKSRKAAKAAKSALYEGSKYPDQDPVEEELQRESVAKRRDGDVDGVSDDNSPPPQSVDEDIGDIKSIVEGREGEIQEMNDKLALVEEKSVAEKRFMQDEISTLQGTISKIEETKEDEIRGVRVELDELNKALAAIQGKEEAAKRAFAALDQDNSELNAEVRKLTEDKVAIEADKVALAGKIAMIESESYEEVKRLKSELDKMKDSLSASEQQAKNEADEFTLQIKKLKHEIGVIGSSVRLNVSKLTSAMDTITSLKSAAEEQTKRAALALEGVKNTLTEGFAKEREVLETKVTAGVAELAALKRDYEGKLEMKDGEIARLEAEISGYKDQVFELDRDLESATSNLDRVRKNRVTLEDESEALKTCKSKLVGEIGAMKVKDSETAAANQEAVRGLDRQIASKNAQLAEYETELTNVKPLVRRLGAVVKVGAKSRYHKITAGAKGRSERIKAGAKRRSEGVRERIRRLRK